MKRRITSIAVAVALLAAIVFAATTDVQAKSLGTPKLAKKWVDITEQVYGKNPESDGRVMRITWKKVSGADGYQVKWYDPTDGWYYKEFTKKRYAQAEGSYIVDNQIKVRAYKKNANGKKVFGKWSKMSVKLNI